MTIHSEPGDMHNGDDIVRDCSDAWRALKLIRDERPARCAEHPAYEADYCPVCGTARVIGGTR